MAALAAQSDVEAILQRALTTQEAVYCATLLNTASGKVREFVGNQVISAVAADVITLPGNWSQRFILPQRPVTNVSSVVINGTTLATTGYVWDRMGNVDVLTGSFMPDASGSMIGAQTNLWGPAGSTSASPIASPNWGGPSAVIVVTYDHGWATVPSSVVDVVAGLVAAAINTPVGIGSEQIGGYKVVYSHSSSGGSMTLTPDMEKSLSRLRVRSRSMSVATQR